VRSQSIRQPIEKLTATAADFEEAQAGRHTRQYTIQHGSNNPAIQRVHRSAESFQL
jgi:hypothetical protein